MEWFYKTKLLLGDRGYQKLSDSHVCVVGVGGVGGYSVEMLARAGVGRITLIDFDKIEVSNLNRQIIALNSNIGFNKVDEFKKRIFNINDKCIVKTYNEKLSENNCNELIGKDYNYVIDAIDDIPNKVVLVKHCKTNNIPIISALGTGNKLSIPNFELTDIYNTSYDPLAKKFRKLLREVCVNSLDVVYSKTENLISDTKEFGTICYSPAMCGIQISAFVINKLLEET